MEPHTGKMLLLFDGYCHLCNHAVKFVLRFDRRKRFVFSPLNSETSIYWKRKLSIPDHLDSIIVIEKERYFSKSAAALFIAKKLGGVFYIATIFYGLPESYRDQLYDWVAAKRYRWFGKSESCMMPDPSDQHRFI